MAVLSVPRPLQERLGDAATDSLVEMFREAEATQAHDHEHQRKEQQEQLFVVLEERFLRHVGASESRLRQEMVESQAGLRQEMGELQTGLRKEIGESENRLRNEMNAGFAMQQEQLTRQQEQIAGVGREIE